MDSSALLESATRPTLQRRIQLFHRRMETLQERILFVLEALDLTHIRSAKRIFGYYQEQEQSKIFVIDKLDNPLH